MSCKEEQRRTAMLLGCEGVYRLEQARVAVFGVGGVGGHLAEALVRSGVGTVDLIDDDTVSVSNINRQAIATLSNIGKAKVLAAKERFLDLNAECKINIHQKFFTPETADEFDFSQYDYVIDAIDCVTSKLLLIEKSYAVNTKIICCMGAGNKLDPTKFEVARIDKTSVCPLARVIRTELRKRNLPPVKVVYSKEEPIKNDFGYPGSSSFVPSAAGLILAGEVIKDLAK